MHINRSRSSIDKILQSNNQLYTISLSLSLPPTTKLLKLRFNAQQTYLATPKRNSDKNQWIRNLKAEKKQLQEKTFNITVQHMMQQQMKKMLIPLTSRLEVLARIQPFCFNKNKAAPAKGSMYQKLKKETLHIFLLPENTGLAVQTLLMGKSGVSSPLQVEVFVGVNNPFITFHHLPTPSCKPVIL